MRHFFRYWLPVLVWMVVIFGASGDARSVQHTDGILAAVLRFLHISLTAEQFETVRWCVRKAAHMTEYAVLALLCWRALRATERLGMSSSRAAAVAFLLCVVYAATDEFHQSFVKTRTPSVYDVMIDTGGACVALAAVWCFSGRPRRVAV